MGFCRLGMLAIALYLCLAPVDTFVPIFIVFIFGAAVGSFLNVVIYRLPAGLSLLYPPSRCPKCEQRLKPYDNVPVFGWMWLLGRCRNCKLPISIRYPMVEFSTGALFVAVFLMFGVTWRTPGYWIFVCWLLSLALIDLDTMTLPNSLTSSGLVLGWIFQGWMRYVESSPSLPVGLEGGVDSGGVGAIASVLGFGGLGGMMGEFNGVLSAMLASVLGLLLFDFVGIAGSRAFGKAAMGGGDAKLAAMMAAWLGLPALLLTTFLAAAMGAVIGSSALALGVLGPKQHIPFGPYLALGALFTLFYGVWMIETYRSIFFPVGW